MPPPLAIRSEFGALEHVVMASPRFFRPVEPINAAMERYFSTEPPKSQDLVDEQARFVAVLQAAGVHVTWATPQSDSPYQLNTRDVGAVVGSEFVVGRMRFPVRQREPDAALDAVEELGGDVIRISSGMFEGGDLLVDGSTVYLGLSQRTDGEAAGQLTRRLAASGFTVESVRLDDAVLHLDVVLNIVAPGLAIAYPAAFPEGLPESIRRRCEVIEITSDEQDRLGANVFSIRPGLVVTDERNPRIAELLAERGLEIVRIDYRETTKIGGSFRCMTLPLVRGES